jgi:hypothetical protein
VNAGKISARCRRIDRGDFEGVGRLFARAVYRSASGGEYRGADEVHAVLERRVIRHEDGTPRTKHVTTNLVIEIDESAGSARARSYFVVLQALAGSPLAPVVAGRYEDTFVREGGTWRFADRLIHLDLVGDPSGHLRGS